MMLNIVLVPAAQVRLEKIAEETGRKIEDLASSAIEEEALAYFRYRKDDPAVPLEKKIPGSHTWHEKSRG